MMVGQNGGTLKEATRGARLRLQYGSALALLTLNMFLGDLTIEHLPPLLKALDLDSTHAKTQPW